MARGPQGRYPWAMAVPPDRRRRRATARLALILAVTAAGATPARAVVPAPGAAPPPAVRAGAVAGVPDLLHGRTAFFTRRLEPDGGTVAFGFTPREVTSRGRLVGDLTYHGPATSGTVEGVLARVGLAGERGCAQVTLDLDPVALPGLAGRAALDPVAVDLSRSPGAVGRLAAALCEGAADLGRLLRDLEAGLGELAPREPEHAPGD